MLAIGPEEHAEPKDQSEDTPGHGREHQKACRSQQEASLQEGQGPCEVPDDPSGQKEHAHGRGRKAEGNGKSGAVEKERRLIDEGEGHEPARDAQPEGFHSGPHGL